jgi:hypothetical protein
MTTAVGTNAAPDPGVPPDFAINTETGEIGTVAELEASAKASPMTRVEVVKPGDAGEGRETVEAKPVVAAKPVVEVDKEAERAAAADRLRAKGAARRARVAEETQLRGHTQSLEQRLAASEQARKAAEAFAARDPLEVLKERGQVGKVFQQAAIDENTPEAIARRAEARAVAAEKRVEALEQGQARRARDAEAVSARDQFIAVATDTTEEGDDGKPTDVLAFPHVAAHVKAGRRESILREADALLRTAKSRGFAPTFAQVVQHLEGEYAKAAALMGAPPPAETTEKVVAAPKPKLAKGANGAGALVKKTQERAVTSKRFEDMEARNTSIDGGTDEQLEYIAELARQEARRQ